MKITGTAEIGKVLKDIEQFSEKVQRNIVEVINETSKFVETEAKRRAPTGVDSNLRASIVGFADAKVEKMPVTQVVVNAHYGPYVEFGTKSKVRIPSGLEGYAQQFRGGSRGSFQDLLNNIRQWAKHKGIDEDAVFPIAVNIARNGIAPQPFLFPAVEAERPKFIKRMKKAIDDTD